MSVILDTPKGELHEEAKNVYESDDHFLTENYVLDDPYHTVMCSTYLVSASIRDFHIEVCFFESHVITSCKKVTLITIKLYHDFSIIIV